MFILHSNVTLWSLFHCSMFMLMSLIKQNSCSHKSVTVLCLLTCDWLIPTFFCSYIRWCSIYVIFKHTNIVLRVFMSLSLTDRGLFYVYVEQKCLYQCNLIYRSYAFLVLYNKYLMASYNVVCNIILLLERKISWPSFPPNILMLMLPLSWITVLQRCLLQTGIAVESIHVLCLLHSNVHTKIQMIYDLLPVHFYVTMQK